VQDLPVLGGKGQGEGPDAALGGPAREGKQSASGAHGRRVPSQRSSTQQLKQLPPEAVRLVMLVCQVRRFSPGSHVC
jgi:hypothetical protein